MVGDIIVNCLHYKNCSEACEAWNRRRQRVNFNNFYIIGNSWNMHEDYNLVERVANLDHSIVFTYKPINHKNCIFLNGDFWKLDDRSIIRPNITDSMPGSGRKYFEKYLDIIKWLNS